jgi:ethanolamine permease
MPTHLKKALSSVHLWALAVGLVISGEYFGWNYGWEVAGTIGKEPIVVSNGVLQI